MLSCSVLITPSMCLTLWHKAMRSNVSHISSFLKTLLQRILDPQTGVCITKGFWSSHSLQRLYNFGLIPRIKCRKSGKIISSSHEWWFLSEDTLRVSNYKAFERQDQSWHCSVTIKSLWRIKDYEASSMERQVWNHTHRLDFALVYVGVESRGRVSLLWKKSVLTHSELDILNKNHAPLHPVGM